MSKMKIGVLQLRVSEDKNENVERASRAIAQAAHKGAELVVLPEMFNCPYQAGLFPAYAERKGGPTWQALSKAASDNKVYVVGGSIPEADDAGKVYNTCFIFNGKGEQIGRHRKVHLFDIDVAGGQVFRESDTLTAGDGVTVFETAFGMIGAAVCYDVRFPELFRLMALKGAKAVVIPAAFNMTTGPAHWELTFRARALDNQVYMIGASSSRNVHSSYVSYGNSIVVSPWGDVVGRLGEGEDTLICEIDTDVVERVRRELPLLRHRRNDVYRLEEGRNKEI